MRCACSSALRVSASALAWSPFATATPASRRAIGTAVAELEDAIFARDVRSDFPVILQTGYSKAKDAETVTALITAKVDVSLLGGQEQAGVLDAACTIFDQGGSYVVGAAERVNFVKSRENPAVTLHWELPGVPTGSYVVRLVVRVPGQGANTAVRTTSMNRTLLVR